MFVFLSRIGSSAYLSSALPASYLTDTLANVVAVETVCIERSKRERRADRL